MYKNEIWKPIINFENLYLVSNYGRIKNIKRNELIKLYIRGGYLSCKLSKNNIKTNFLVHRLVALMFIKNINNVTQVNHKDGDKLNNYVENLEWCTPKENIRHSWVNGLSKSNYKDNITQRKLNINDVQFIRNNKKIKRKELANKFNVSITTINSVINYKYYK